MNLTQRPRPNAPFTAVRPNRATLSARQLFDVELGLVLLGQLAPTARPDCLPALLNGTTPEGHTHWTAKQRRCLSRGRDLLIMCRQSNRWNDLLDRYSRLTNQMLAFDISHDRSRFNQKSVGFFRNRVLTLQQLLA